MKIDTITCGLVEVVAVWFKTDGEIGQPLLLWPFV